MRVDVEVPATTSNLGPGFDAVGLALELCNRFEARIVEDPAAATLTVLGYGEAELAGQSDTAVHIGMRAAANAMGKDLPLVALTLHNAVPLGSGLGSSSTALCGGLALGRALCGGDDDRDWLLHHACLLEGHPDNAAPCVLGGLVIAAHDAATGRTRALAVPTPERLRCVAVTPALSLSTALMRAALPRSLPLGDVIAQGVHATLLGAALALGRLDLLATATQDRLHEAARGAHIPGFAAVRAAGLAAGALAVPISGAGPTMIALVDGDASCAAIGAAMVQAFAEAGLAADARILAPRALGLQLLTHA